MRPPTFFVDVDGTILKHRGCLSGQMTMVAELLPGALERFLEWDRMGAKIILITGRRESCRQDLEADLADLGIFYDELVMGCTGGMRIIINDKKADGTATALAINPNHNEGLANVQIE